MEPSNDTVIDVLTVQSAIVPVKEKSSPTMQLLNARGAVWISVSIVIKILRNNNYSERNNSDAFSNISQHLERTILVFSEFQ